MIHLDHHAASPLVAEARDAMDRARDVAWANPSSTHAAGRACRAVLEESRRRVAEAIGARSVDVVLTAGGSEACQTGIVGVARGVRRIVTSSIEHPAVERTVASLAANGVEVVTLRPTPTSGIDLDALDPLLTSDTLVAMQWVNHEVGAILPVPDVALRCRSRGARLFVDATQALGKIEVDVGALGPVVVAFASTKIGGPAGAGALYVAPGVALEPLLLGGAQERGLRAGTPDVLAHAGFGAAASAVRRRLATMPEVARRRGLLEVALERLGGEIHARALPRVATCASVAFRGRRATVLAAALDLEGVAVATGPACSSGLDSPSPTVRALRPDAPELASSTLRFSLGPETTEAEIETAVAAVIRVLERVVPARIEAVSKLP